MSYKMPLKSKKFQIWWTLLQAQIRIRFLIIFGYLKRRNKMGPKVKWTIEEQDFLKVLRENEQLQSWKEIAERINEKFGSDVKNGKQCRERYVNYVRFRQGSSKLQATWTPDDDETFLKLYLENGPKWSLIVKEFTTKSENSLKNRFYGGLRRIVRKINIVEKSHRLRGEKSICYKSLVRIFEQDINEKGQTLETQLKNLETQEFLRRLRMKILRQAWRLLDGEEDDQPIIEIIKMIHQLGQKIKKQPNQAVKKLLKSQTSQESEKPFARITRRQKLLIKQVISQIDAIGCSKELSLKENQEILENNLPRILPFVESQSDFDEISENYSLPQILFNQEFYEALFNEDDGEFNLKNIFGNENEQSLFLSDVDN